MTDVSFQDIVSSGPNLRSEKEWKIINNEMLTDCLPGITAKIEIGGHDLYLKTTWFDGRIVRIDITVSRGRGVYDNLPMSGHSVTLETTRYDLARSWLENECRMASNLLQTGKAGIGTVIEEWTMVEGFPSGHCPQLPAKNVETGDSGPTYQCGPLHAVAMVLRRRLPEWTALMRCD